MAKAPTWIKRWGTEIARSRLPGVWKLRSGGCLVRAHVKDPASGRLREIRKRMPLATDAVAFAWLEAERTRVRGAARQAPAAMRFDAFAASVLEEKVALRRIKSARGREKWKNSLANLILGVGSAPGFGTHRVDRISPAFVRSWQVEIAKMISAGTYRPATANTWLAILKHVMSLARKRLDARDPTEDIPAFATDEHPTYTAEEPNALSADEAQRFLSLMRSEFPQHYAMTVLGFVTGLRPSHMRPLRRSGASSDVKWSEGVILVRRSHTLDEVMETTKTGVRQQINVPPSVLSILRWHLETQLLTEEQAASDLLFPAEDGRPRSESVLKKPFAAVRALMGLRKKVTPRAMRRTFNDLARQARVEAIVTRSISGHLTTEMQEHYSTVSPDEQRAAVGTVLRLVGGDSAVGTKAKTPKGRDSKKRRSA